MKIRGKKISGANEVVIVIPRASDEDIVLKARAVLNMAAFEEMCPVPNPPTRLMANGDTVPNLKDPGYLKSCSRYSITRLSWIVLNSLQATEGLEWEKVDLGDSNTWDSFRDEFKEAGLSDIEINRVVAECINVNALNEEKIEEARERFLLAHQERSAE